MSVEDPRNQYVIAVIDISTNVEIFEKSLTEILGKKLIKRQPLSANKDSDVIVSLTGPDGKTRFYLEYNYHLTCDHRHIVSRRFEIDRSDDDEIKYYNVNRLTNQHYLAIRELDRSLGWQRFNALREDAIRADGKTLAIDLFNACCRQADEFTLKTFKSAKILDMQYVNPHELKDLILNQSAAAPSRIPTLQEAEYYHWCNTTWGGKPIKSIYIPDKVYKMAQAILAAKEEDDKTLDLNNFDMNTTTNMTTFNINICPTKKDVSNAKQIVDTIESMKQLVNEVKLACRGPHNLWADITIGEYRYCHSGSYPHNIVISRNGKTQMIVEAVSQGPNLGVVGFKLNDCQVSYDECVKAINATKHLWQQRNS